MIRTEYRDQGQPYERTNVRFGGVIGYMLRDNLSGILFDIEEDSLERILAEHAADFEWGSRYGWPWPSASRNTDPREHVKSSGARVFRIQSSTGFDGFVIAREMRLEEAEPAIGADG